MPCHLLQQQLTLLPHCVLLLHQLASCCCISLLVRKEPGAGVCNRSRFSGPNVGVCVDTHLPENYALGLVYGTTNNCRVV